MTQKPTNRLEYDVDRDLNALEAILRKTHRHAQAPVVVEGALWLAATLSAVALSALMIGLLAPDGVAIFEIILGTGSTLTLVMGAIALIRLKQSDDPAMAGARAVQNAEPSLRNDLTSGLQFGRELSANRASDYSRTLAAEHVRLTVRKVLGMVDGNGSLAHLLPPRDTTPAALALGTGLLALTIIAFVWPNDIRGLFIETSQNPETATNVRPVVGDLDVFIQPPAYTDLPSNMLPFTTGNIRVLVGSEVTISTYPLVDATRYELILTTGDGDRPLPLSIKDKRLETSFLATKPGSYQFRAVLADGSQLQDQITRTIELLPDEPPTINILSHQGEVEVSPDEVLVIEFSVQDDFGIEAVVQTHGFENEEPKRRALNLPALASVPDSLDGKFVLDLTPLDLQPKDSVVFVLEASDNNTLTGPGVGKSQPIVLRVASPEDKHIRVIEAQQQVLEALLSIMADFLENPVGTRVADSRGFYDQDVGDVPQGERTPKHTAIHTINTQLGTILKNSAEVIERMDQDPLMLQRDFSLFKSLHDQLYNQQHDGQEMLLKLQSKATEQHLERRDLQRIANFAAKMEDSLEKGILRLQDLLAAQKMEAIQATAKDIKALKQRLRELLEKYKESRDPELKKAIKREIQRLRARMRELMERMQSQLQELPQEHANLDAIKAQQLESDAQKLANNMQSIEEMLDNDDIDGALAALDRMTENLDSLTQEMDSQFSDAQPKGLSELDKALSKMMDSVDDLEIAQRSVEEQTAAAQEQVMREHREKMKSLIKKMSRDILRQIQEQQRAINKLPGANLPEHEQKAIREASDRLDALKEMLQQQDVEQASELAKLSVDELRTLQFGLQLMERYTKPGSRSYKSIRGTRKSLDDAIPRGENIRRQLADMMEKAQNETASVNKQDLQKLAKQQERVKQQAQKLQEQIGEASQKFPMVGQQLAPGAQKASDAIEGAQQSLQGNKVQQGLDGQRQALDELNKLKQSMKESLQKEKRGKKGRKLQKDHVEIPKNEKADKKKHFRESIMKNMKGGRLDNYADEIERYYKSLME